MAKSIGISSQVVVHFWLRSLPSIVTQSGKGAKAGQIHAATLWPNHRLGCLCPQQRLTNHDLTKLVETSDEWIIPRQANLRTIEAAAKQMKVPLGRFIVNIEQYGNTSAASIPPALSEGLNAGRIQPTDKLLLVAFGAGLTWSVVVMQMQHSSNTRLGLG